MLGFVPVVLGAVLIYGATIGDEDALSLAVGALVLAVWIAMIAGRRRF